MTRLKRPQTIVLVMDSLSHTRGELADAERLVDTVLDLEIPGYRSIHILAGVLKMLIKIEIERAEVSR